MAVQSSVQRFRVLAERLGHIRDSLDLAASHPDSLTDGARMALETVTAVFDMTTETLRTRWSALEHIDEVRRDSLRLDLCNDLQDVVRELGSTLLPLLTAARFEAVPVELEPVLARIADEAAPDWSVHNVVVGSPEYNYSIQYLQDPIAKWANALGWLGETPGPASEGALLLLSVPRTERQAATLHSVLLGHEIGHLFDWYHRISENYPIPTIEEITESKTPTFADYFRYELFVAVSRNWLREIVADFYGAVHLGPASILALVELVSGLAPLELDSLTHPGTDRRTYLVGGLLEKLGYDFSGSSFAYLEPLISSVSGAPARPIELPLEIKERLTDSVDVAGQAWDWIHSVRESLWDVVVAPIDGSAGMGSTSWSQVEELSEALRLGRTVGERLTDSPGAVPCSTFETLNAGWLVKMEGLESLAGIVRADLNQWDELARVAHVLDELVLKSIEISEYRRLNPWV